LANALLILGIAIASTAALGILMRFSEVEEHTAREELRARLSGQMIPAPGAGSYD
jgi:hypothetical protein